MLNTAKQVQKRLLIHQSVNADMPDMFTYQKLTADEIKAILFAIGYMLEHEREIMSEDRTSRR